MDFMMLATELNAIGKLIYNNLYQWVQGWASDYAIIGAFGVTVILFSLFLRMGLLPLDIWQKMLSRKNAKKMEIMKPELDKINKQCGENRELLMQKQRILYKKHKYSAFSACLPSLATMAVFIIIFSGFNSAVRHHNSLVYENLSVRYEEVYSTEIAKSENEKPTEEEKSAAVKAAEDAVIAAYQPERFLLTTNIFMPDTWVSPIPDIQRYQGTGIGKLGITEVDKSDYNKVMQPIMDVYNTNEEGKKVWNGYLILPIISFALSIISSRLIKPPEQPQMAGQTEEQLKAQRSQAKVMNYMMPVMMGAFTLFYSTAFALYMVVGNLFSTSFNLLFNVVTKRMDDKEREIMLSTTIKK
ncbi:MAG: membrane protein insertase YidC [Clostridia bacterium]